MNEKLIIPAKIKVGYGKRDDTYTTNLGYVIYQDNKEVWRKEAGWENWRDKKIKPQFFDNKPMEGFVLNKGVGGGNYGWHGREAKIRIYDPRDFEFEIPIDNLLFILAYCNAYKGKGLEGEFVYAWQGKDLVLLPVECQEYKASVQFTAIQTNKLTIKELIPGCSYKTKQMDDLIYLGRFDYHWYNNEKKISKDTKKYDSNDQHYYNKSNFVTKEHIFVDKNDNFEIKGANILSNINSDNPVENYADLVERFYKTKHGSKIIGLSNKPDKIEVKNITSHSSYYANYYQLNLDETYSSYKIEIVNSNYDYTVQRYLTHSFKITIYSIISFKNEILEEINLRKLNDSTYSYGSRYKDWKYNTKTVSEEEFLNMKFVKLFVLLESGREIEYNQY